MLLLSARSLRGIGLLLLGFLLAGVAVADDLPDLVSKIPGDRRQVQIVKVEFSNTRPEATATFSTALGIFAFDIDLRTRNLAKVTLVILEQEFCEGLTFRGKEAPELDLRTTHGARIARAGKNIVIELTGDALRAMGAGGRVQFVNQYR